MANRNAQAIAIHARHEARKLRPMVRTSAEHIKLPLMNHFMRQRPCDLPVRPDLEAVAERVEIVAASYLKDLRRMMGLWVRLG